MYRSISSTSVCRADAAATRVSGAELAAIEFTLRVVDEAVDEAKQGERRRYHKRTTVDNDTMLLRTECLFYVVVQSPQEVDPHLPSCVQ